jgi:hypothetical protein
VSSASSLRYEFSNLQLSKPENVIQEDTDAKRNIKVFVETSSKYD